MTDKIKKLPAFDPTGSMKALTFADPNYWAPVTDAVDQAMGPDRQGRMNRATGGRHAIAPPRHGEGSVGSSFHAAAGGRGTGGRSSPR